MKKCFTRVVVLKSKIRITLPDSLEKPKHDFDMENMNELFLFTLPFIILLAVILFLAYYLLRFEKLRAISKLKSKNTSTILNMRLQAFERILLFLERISPQQLVVRNNNPNLTVVEFQMNLISNIREEYEHNLVQQLYVSEESWAMTEQARSWVMKLINDAAATFNENESSRELAMLIVEKEMKVEKNYIGIAIKQLKKEVRELF